MRHLNAGVRSQALHEFASFVRCGQPLPMSDVHLSLSCCHSVPPEQATPPLSVTAPDHHPPSLCHSAARPQPSAAAPLPFPFLPLLNTTTPPRAPAPPHPPPPPPLRLLHSLLPLLLLTLRTLTFSSAPGSRQSSPVMASASLVTAPATSPGPHPTSTLRLSPAERTTTSSRPPTWASSRHSWMSVWGTQVAGVVGWACMGACGGCGRLGVCASAW